MNNKNTTEALDEFTDRLMLEIEKLRTKILQGKDYLDPKHLLEIIHTDLEVLSCGIKYEIDKIKYDSSISSVNNPSLNNEELCKTRAVLQLLTLTAKISDNIEQTLDNSF